MINFTTGPVGILPSVSAALAEPPLSHRSKEFIALYKNVADSTSHQLNVKETFILTGSGTLANEVMIAQIALRNEHGLILSNGEFGDRLIKQATRQQIDFEVLSAPLGEALNIEHIAAALAMQQIKWVLFCHCESSTGVINLLSEITELCRKYGCEVYVDCMSTFSTMKLDLSAVSMATASSGKAIGAYAGLALVFCNNEIRSGKTLPLYLDLLHTQNTNGVPFTLSSNLLKALQVAVKHNLNEQKWQELSRFSALIYKRLNDLKLIPFAAPGNCIFTIIPQNVNAQELAQSFFDTGIELSCNSNYLIQKNWLQLALFSSYTNADVNHLLQSWSKIYKVSDVPVAF